MIILDTDVVAVAMGTSAHDAATAWLSLQNPHQLYLTAITRAAAFDIAAADCYGDIVADRDRAGIPIGSADAQIAAIARVHDALVATRDSNGFAGTGVATVNPFGG
ncbi:hypothetical protein GII30_11325 [Gordonia amarae]|uniref:PIN domain-containing protein n=2 Tax=Gordonia amarae TaxID=36821 RepID=G7GLH5_9ACTN|nr:hypothetical protein [Gordonia amarae]MCS3878973.1 putative nucleic acid-binding protein [Gordonia amarae]QHN17519.1 hypothetical protein GII35_11535 [Gordonia amarae]QHN22045.1 hypothetical protein GII34_11315 [Gordonia amarae]QHN30926.1 hypothetical protein GII32_11490 [Gordonia amarae]QHN39672.1 hypothetical protein GII30_11325 [Gordonia amarae]